MLTCQRSDLNKLGLLGLKGLLCLQAVMCDKSWHLESGRCDLPSVNMFVQWLTKPVCKNMHHLEARYGECTKFQDTQLLLALLDSLGCIQCVQPAV